ncbi:hypothetical protein D3C72_2503340 [compost metagenome]
MGSRDDLEVAAVEFGREHLGIGRKEAVWPELRVPVAGRRDAVEIVGPADVVALRPVNAPAARRDRNVHG